MRRTFLFVALTFCLASPALAQNPYGGCNATLRTQGVCSPTSVAWFAFSVPDAQMVSDIQAWTLDIGNYQTTVPCSSDRVTERGIVLEAGVTEGDCTAGQLGTEVSNPQSTNEFGYLVMRGILRAAFLSWLDGQAHEAVPDTPEPAFGADPP